MATSASTSYFRSENPTRANENAPVAGAAPPPPSPAATPVVSDAYWVPDVEHMDAARRQKPWRADPHFFTSVSVSLSATVKMFMHGTRGCPDVSQGRFNWFEVMGLLVGHFRERELVLTDSFSLPVSASEVECSMTEASQIYMANYLEYHRRLGKAEPGCVGWYHTHPGYSCFLSGIDVTTQQGSQRMQDPWVALVIDPVETLRTGQFSMKAFRTYPEGYTLPDSAEKATGADNSESRDSPPATPPPFGVDGHDGSMTGSSFGLPPTNRMKNFGMHANRYYELPVKVVQSSRDAPLWALLQQHFWPLSLSLTFPFAVSTRTCQCSSKELMRLIAALADATTDGRLEGRHSNLSGVLSRSRPEGRFELVQMPALYRLSHYTSQDKDAATAGSVASDPEKTEEKKAYLERRLLALAHDTLQARTESFSLMNASQPVHKELLQALRVVSAAPKRTSAKKGS